MSTDVTPIKNTPAAVINKQIPAVTSFRAAEKESNYDTFIKQQEKEQKNKKRTQNLLVALQIGTFAAFAVMAGLAIKNEFWGMGQSKKELNKIWENLKGADKLEDLALPESLTDFVHKLKMDIENPNIVKKRGGKPIRAVLMHGPAGTGKTSFAKAIAQEYPNAKFASIDMARLDSEYKSVGDKNLINAIDLISKEAEKSPDKKIFVFLDEIDSIMMVDNSLNAADSNKTLNVFKRELENKLLKHDNVIVIGATNLPINVETGFAIGGKRLDAAMLSRFREKILVDLPTSTQASTKFARSYKYCELVDDTLKNASDKQLTTLTDFLTKREHNVSFRTIESIIDVAAHDIRKENSKVGMKDLLRAIKSKQEELNFNDAEFNKLLSDLGIKPTDLK